MKNRFAILLGKCPIKFPKLNVFVIRMFGDRRSIVKHES